MFFVLLIGICGTMVVLAASSVIRMYIATGALIFNPMINASVSLNNTKVAMGLFGYSFLNAIVNFPVLLLAYEMIYRSALLRHTEKERMKLEKEKLHAELSLLKGIINPHFLFNNLNSLSSLITEDPLKAQDFLDELTQVFRYLLRNNQNELTSLDEELKFIETYYQLLKTRYGAAINMTIDIGKPYYDFFLPPLTLQLLVENAVKHNQLQKDAPLHIQLQSLPNNQLIVRNNVFLKNGKTESTGMGLYSINTRYKILNKPGLIIDKTDSEFAVTIPLIN